MTQEELDRAKTGLKASTIMQGESTSARAGAIAHDFFMRGRIRTLDEIKGAIDGVFEKGQCVAGEESAGAFYDCDGGAERTSVAVRVNMALTFRQHQLSNGLEIIAEENPDSLHLRRGFREDGIGDRERRSMGFRISLST